MSVAVNFIGSEKQRVAERERILGGTICSNIFAIRPDVVRRWLTFLIAHNPLYSDVVICDDAIENLSLLQKQVIDSVIVSSDALSMQIEKQTTSNVAKARVQHGQETGETSNLEEILVVTQLCKFCRGLNSR